MYFLKSLLPSIIFIFLINLSRTIKSQSQTSLPSIDWSALGNVGLIGSFSAISIYNSSNNSTSNKFDSSSSTLLSIDPTTNSLTSIAKTNQGGQIHSICHIPNSNKLVIGGSFKSLNSVNTLSNIAIYDPTLNSTSQIYSLDHGLDGPVYTINCDVDQNLIWIGGSFNHPLGLSSDQLKSFGPNIITWSINTSSFKPVPFVGLNGPVWSIYHSISKSGKSLILGGSFSILLNSNSNLNHYTLSSSSNQAAQKAGAPINFTSLGSSLSPISLNQASVSAQPSSTKSGYNSPQNVFCPKDVDGPGTSWQVQSPFETALFTVTLDRAVQAGGIRLGNSYADGGSTHGFQVVSIPDNTVLQLTHVDPITNLITTCQTNCTLTRDFAIPYQDFLFPTGTSLTGFQIVINSKYGNVAGLHLVQLLSIGNIAYAVNKLNPTNQTTCSLGLGATGGISSSTAQGDWKEVSTNANITGTIKPVLTSNVPIGTTPENGPSLVWSIYVSQSGVYDVSVYVPGCQNMNDCDSRTSVDVMVQPVGSGPITTTVDQRNRLDASVVVYNGTLTASALNGGLTVTMKLANTVQGANVVMVADEVIIRAHSSNGTTNGILSHGLFEYVLEGSGAFGDGSGNVNDTTLNAVSTVVPLQLNTPTAIDTLGTRLGSNVTVKSLVNDQSTTFVSGDGFNLSTPSSSITIPNAGLDGSVISTVISGGYVYAAGNFSSTIDRTVLNLQGLARWKFSEINTTWESLGNSGLAGQLTKLSVIDNLVYATSTGVSGAGLNGRSLAVYDPSKSTWVTTSGGLIVGNVTAITGTSKIVYLAGNIVGAASIATPGSGALISTGDKVPKLSPFGFQMNQTATIQQTAEDAHLVVGAAGLTKRWLHSNSFDDLIMSSSSLNRRQVLNTSTGASSNNDSSSSSLPFAFSSTSSATILAGAFWTDSKSILGGRFVTNTNPSLVNNIGIYDQSTGLLTPLNGTKQLQGEVMTLKVINNTVWVGGTFISPSGKNGLDTYDLMTGQWSNTIMPSPISYPNTNVSIRAITSRSSGNEIIVAGSFNMMGSLPCQSICLRSTTNAQWQSLGTGLKGLVNSIDFSGKNKNVLVAGGSFTIDGATVRVAKWDFSETNNNNGNDASWKSLGEDQSLILGTVKSLVTNNDETFVTGLDSNNNNLSSYLVKYDGKKWITIEGLSNYSKVEHLAFVPIQNSKIPTIKTNVNGIEIDRMLLVSGNILLNNQNFSSALWDGQNWFGYLSTINENGKSGVISKMISVAESFRSSARHFFSVGIVIVISMAIALGIIFIGVLIGLLIALRMRSKENTTIQEGYAIGHEEEEEEEAIERRARPTSLLATIDAATMAMTDRMRNLQRQSEVLTVNEKGKEKSLMEDISPVSPNHHHHQRQTMVNVGSEAEDEEEDHEDHDHELDGRQEGYIGEDIDQEIDVRRARWSFDPQLPGEIAVGAGESVEIKDRNNPEWWLVRRADGVEGVVPADWFL
ncbi:hypothetical protein CROQUDRAFT_81484 [Cronartium quercuum f. sp. fusiforme G11]|uniref:SH3 domain-containing protein n=1 Tax=Cronartium quercuum f. sp. fusiforme G11 TaxID=708437 RepID=A0A9P6NF66_9BASI|nr:hypothetical protein CROQUDRAFT_81484 [Cronartium quercuum f. sp. fusiforme G11]